MNRTYKYGTYQKTIVFGIVTKVGELKTIGQDRIPHFDFTVKTVEYYKPKNDPTTLKEFIKWHNCRSFGKMAEFIEAQNIEVGDLIKVDGSFDYSRAADISAAVNQFVTIKVGSFNMILKQAEIMTTAQQDEDSLINSFDSEFDFEPIEQPDNKTDVQ